MQTPSMRETARKSSDEESDVVDGGVADVGHWGHVAENLRNVLLCDDEGGANALWGSVDG